MLDKFRRLREQARQGDQGRDNGFTLIELLVVVVIIGILIAIAIPLYLNYEKGANDKSAQSDLRGAVSVLEQCNSDNSTYPAAAFTLTASGAAGGCTGQINLSSNSTLQYKTPAGDTGAPTNSYTITSKNSGGSGKVYCYDSFKGGSVTTTSNAIGSTTC